MRNRNGYKLRLILGLLVIGSVVLTAAVGCYYAWKANKASLISGYLESNYQYAKKLSLNTTEMLQIMFSNIDAIAAMAGKKTISQDEMNIWYYANENYFNSIIMVDPNNKVQAVSSRNGGMKVGTVLSSAASRQAIEQKRHLISEPYLGVTNRLIVLVSAPIFDDEGSYLGFIGGSIYLEESNVLSKMLNEHFYGNGSYVYVTDQLGQLLFHPDKTRLLEIIKDNEVLNRALSGQSGAQPIVNSKGKSFYAGYAYEPLSGWAIVAQTPTSILDKPLKKLIFDILLKSLPLFILILLMAWRVSVLISKPLYDLARFSEEAIASAKAIRSEIPRTKSSIYEVRQLNESINNHLKLLNKEIQLDGLTGLANRKTFDITIKEWLEDDIPFALILLDIDHFKRINDEHGHLVGDEVLKYTASQIRACSKTDDLCFRYGGEEFGVLSRFSDITAATAAAERLRESFAAKESPSGSPIYVSIGISSSHKLYFEAVDIIGMADKALYQSKENGRNRITVCMDDKIGQPC